MKHGGLCEISTKLLLYSYLSLILLHSSLIYMYIILFTCNTLIGITVICKVFLLISLYKKKESE